MPSKRQPYVGYYTNPSKQTDVTKVAELIHRRRRQVALHSYLYYCLDESVITDHQYEYLVLNLIEMQTRFPQIAASVNFMKRMFLEHDFSATGFHLGSYVKNSNSKAAESVVSAANRLVEHHKKQELDSFQAPDIDEKISRCTERLARL